MWCLERLQMDTVILSATKKHGLGGDFEAIHINQAYFVPTLSGKGSGPVRIGMETL